MNTCPVLVGRGEELHLFESILGGGGCVLVAGEAGIGKSRLLREFRTLSSALDRGVVWGRPESIARPGPYSLIFDLLDWLASETTGSGAEISDLLDALHRMMEHPEPPARQVAARIRGLLCEFTPPAVALVEDLHLADELSLAVLAHLARASADDGYVMAASFRPEESRSPAFERFLDVLTREGLAEMIELKPLDDTALREMLVAMWSREPTDDELHRLTDQAEGVPFFVEELAAASGELGQGIPPSVARAVSARVGRLSERTRSAVRAAAVVGGPVDVSLMSQLTELPEQELSVCLFEALGSGILVDEGGRLAFRHELVREAISQELNSVQRVGLHDRIANALIARAEDATEAVAKEIAEHLWAAGHPEQAVAYWVEAAERALAVGALEEARRLFQIVLDQPKAQQDARATTGMGMALYRSGEIDAAANWLRQGASLFVSDGRPREAATALWRLASIRAIVEPLEACAILDDALELVPEHTDPNSYVQLLVRKGSVLVRQAQDVQAGAEQLERGLELAESLGLKLLEAEAAEALAWVAEERGDRSVADRLGERACHLAVEGGDGEVILRAHGGQATRLGPRGRGSDALALLETTVDHLVPGFGAFHLAAVNHLRAWILWLMGQPREADRFAARVETTRFAAIYGRIVRVWSAMERGEEWVARSIIDAWWDDLGGAEFRLDCVSSAGDLPDSAMQVILAELVLRAALTEAPEHEVLELAARFDDMCRGGRPDNVGLGSTLRARLLLAAGKSAEAERILAVFDEDSRIGHYPLRLAAALELRGLMEASRNELEQASSLLRRATELLGEAANGSDRARCLRLLAKVDVAAGGDREAAIRTLRDARDIAIGAGALVQVNLTEAALRALGVRPRAGRPKGSGTPQGMLSAREEEVAILVAVGATNAEIARRLFLSEKTVENHISRAQKRLAVVGRAGLAAWAAKQGLV